jgi:hypothetical protein
MRGFFAVFSGIEIALVHPCVPKAVFNPFGIGNSNGNAPKLRIPTAGAKNRYASFNLFAINHLRKF